MFQTLLIANRGEIACRIIRTAKRLGIQTVAVYSDADQHALHVKQADRAVYLGPSPAESSYLNVEAIIAAAVLTNAQAIHPGYGFVSESPLLAKSCEEKNIVFIGPSVHALEIMGSKQQAKACLANTPVPLTPGYHGADQSIAALTAEAKKIGFPVLIKAAAGGGGKGMRVIHQADELKAALTAAAREAQAYFADPTLILEKYIPQARHVEVQILGDTQGHVIHLFDRDCSVQRRHQKIIEEAPAPYLPPTTRTQLHKAACEVAKMIDYVGAGTIEFLVEPSGAFYFMEMNTRLQVEHPVTEAITGLDLVEWQIRIALGESLPADFSAIESIGHAIECRIYAEDPTKDFLPATGQFIVCSTPQGDHIRLDTGYTSGDTLTPYYDPLLAKLITHGTTRQEAIQKMQLALKQYCIAGLATNLSFLQAILQYPDFIEGHLSTHFLTEHPISSFSSELPLPVMFILFANEYAKLASNEPIQEACFGWHPFLPRTWEISFQHLQETIVGEFEAHSQKTFALTFQNNTYKLQYLTSSSDMAQGTRLAVSDGKQNYQGLCYDITGIRYCFYDGQTYVFQQVNSTQAHQHTAANHASPMPGTVVAILKKEGDAIQADEGILIIEAMKMEHTIRAAEAGVLTEIFYKTGDQVIEGAQLFELQEMAKS